MDGPSRERAPVSMARLAGALYLLTISLGIYAEVFVRGAIVVSGDASQTATNLVARESLYRWGLGADIGMLICYVLVTLLFYELFRPRSKTLSLLAALFSMAGIAVLAANCINHIAPLIYLTDAAAFSAFDAKQLEALALASLRLHARGYSVSLVFFGVYCGLLGYLIFRSEFVPRWLGVLMLLGGASYVVDSYTSYLAPDTWSVLPPIGIVAGFAELALSLWLIAFGVNSAKWPGSAQGSGKGTPSSLSPNNALQATREDARA